MQHTKEKFATQVDREILSAIKQLAQGEGRQIQALIGEALSDLIEKRKNAQARPHVMDAYMGSHGKYKGLYEKLAK